MNRRLANAIAVIVTIVWTLNLLAAIYVVMIQHAKYQVPLAVNLPFGAITGAVAYSYRKTDDRRYSGKDRGHENRPAANKDPDNGE